MSKRENSSSLILQNLKKRDLARLGEPVVPIDEAERLVMTGMGPAAASDDPDSTRSYRDSMIASTPEGNPDSLRTRLKPKERVARSALIVRLDPALHRRLEAVARHNRLTMNDIAIEAIELHLRDFPHPPGFEPDRP